MVVINENLKKITLIILQITLLFLAGYAVGEKITEIKCNNFIQKEYINNPAYASIFNASKELLYPEISVEIMPNINETNN